jgi:hypothetical protein
MPISTGDIVFILIAGWLPISFPSQTSKIYVYPSHNLMIPFGYPYVSPYDTMSISILQNWSANQKKSSAWKPIIESAIRQVDTVLSGHPSFYSREQLNAKNMPHIPSGLLRYYLDSNKIKLKSDMKCLIFDFPKIDLSGYPYNDTVRLSQVHRSIHILYKRKKYKIRINIYLGLLYP